MNAEDSTQKAQELDRMVEEWQALAKAQPGYHRFSEEQFAGLYSAASACYRQGKYADAANFFSMLVLYRPFCCAYLFGLAASLQMDGRHEAALPVYTLILLLDRENRQAALHAAECMIQVGQAGAARDVLQTLLAEAGYRPELAALGEKAQAYLQLLEKNDHA